MEIVFLLFIFMIVLSVIGVIANPMSGRDVRRLAARAPQQTPESKRNQIQRLVIARDLLR